MQRFVHGLAIFLIILAICLESSGQTPPLEVQPKNIEFRVTEVARSSPGVTFNATVSNIGGNTIYLAFDPKDLQGRSEFYRWIEGGVDQQLNIGVRLFPPIFPDPPANAAGVRLRLLKPRESVSFEFGLDSVISETIPPVGSLQFDKLTSKPVLQERSPRTVKLESLKQIQIQFGYFLKDESLERFLDGQSERYRVQGRERLKRSGKAPVSLLDLQLLATTSLVLR